MKKYAVFAVVALALGIGVGWVSAYSTVMLGTEKFITDPALLSGDAAASEPVAEGEQPRVQVVNGERYAFGEMLVGATLTRTFEVKNLGNAPLTLELIETTCKCTLTDITKATVRPNETVDVKLEWKAESSTPVFNQGATFRTNDPARPTLYLSIEGVVEEAARVVPRVVQFSNVPGQEAAERVLRVYATKRAADLEITGVEFGSGPLAEHLSYKLRELSREELADEPRAVGGHELRVQLKPGLPTGKLDGTMRLLLNVPEQPVLEVPIAGNVISDISVLGRGVPFNSERNVLFLGPVKQSEGRKAELLVLIKGPNREQVELEVAKVDPEVALRATLGESTKTDKLVTIPLIVEVPQGAPLVSRLGTDTIPAGTILIRARNTNTKEIAIEVRFAVN